MPYKVPGLCEGQSYSKVGLIIITIIWLCFIIIISLYFYSTLWLTKYFATCDLIELSCI